MQGDLQASLKSFENGLPVLTEDDMRVCLAQACDCRKVNGEQKSIEVFRSSFRVIDGSKYSGLRCRDVKYFEKNVYVVQEDLPEVCGLPSRWEERKGVGSQLGVGDEAIKANHWARLTVISARRCVNGGLKLTLLFPVIVSPSFCRGINVVVH